MNHIDLIKNFVCPYCKTNINHCTKSTFEGSIVDYECECKNTTYTHFTNTDSFQFFLNLYGPLQIQINANPQKALFSVIEYPPNDEVMDIRHAFAIILDYVPEHLTFNDPVNLQAQIETLITFQ